MKEVQALIDRLIDIGFALPDNEGHNIHKQVEKALKQMRLES
jgi:hypothetical protein